MLLLNWRTVLGTVGSGAILAALIFVVRLRKEYHYGSRRAFWHRSASFMSIYDILMRLVIMAEPGRLRDGLQTVLDSFRSLEPAVLVDDGPSALEAIRTMQPDLVILDTDLFGKATAEFVRVMKQAWTQAFCIVIADRLGQFRPLRDAGADQVLLKGFSATELAEVLRQALGITPGNGPGPDPPHAH